MLLIFRFQINVIDLFFPFLVLSCSWPEVETGEFVTRFLRPHLIHAGFFRAGLAGNPVLSGYTGIVASIGTIVPILYL